MDIKYITEQLYDISIGGQGKWNYCGGIGVVVSCYFLVGFIFFACIFAIFAVIRRWMEGGSGVDAENGQRN
jgi:hypothetical protein